jgi:hypothetical protein
MGTSKQNDREDDSTAHYSFSSSSSSSPRRRQKYHPRVSYPHQPYIFPHRQSQATNLPMRGLLILFCWTDGWSRVGGFAPRSTARTKLRPAPPLQASLPTSITADVAGNTGEDANAGPQTIVGGGLPPAYVTLPRHSHAGVNDILKSTEDVVRQLHVHSKKVQQTTIQAAKEKGRAHEKIYANNYVDLAKVDTVGFDFDYTLVSYTDELLETIYDMALNRLVTSRQYPLEMLDSGLVFDPFFSIRGLAVDTMTGWICHLSSTHKVALAYEGRKRVPTDRIYAEYRGKRGMPPEERRRRIRPLNDLYVVPRLRASLCLHRSSPRNYMCSNHDRYTSIYRFSMSECCLIADTVQFFKDHDIPYNAQSLIKDVSVLLFFWWGIKSNNWSSFGLPSLTLPFCSVMFCRHGTGLVGNWRDAHVGRLSSDCGE